ncbi:MAG: DUF2461 domain-containing protein [Flavobacteriales bacterium]|nr:DUF2461 domain-containing protein [Flavobacteriales bacterium]
MAYFQKDFIDFFKELERNNHRDWFQDNRTRYEKNVRDPFKAFIGDLISEIKKHDPSLELEPKNAIFRINRDIRFSKDKTPYKTNVSAAISHGGKKAKDDPGLYLGFGAKQTTIGGGSYGIEKESLYFLRDYIANNTKEFRKVVDAKAFKGMYGEILGERNKIVPKEFREALEVCPEIANKHFYFMDQIAANAVIKDNLMEVVMEHYHVAKDVREFLCKGLHST